MVHNFDPILIDFGLIQIRWYSMAYVFGILIGWWFGKIVIKKQIDYKDQKNYLKNYDDLIAYIIIGVILGGRLGYIIFYNPSFYLENLSEIFKLWKGGMSFHGGLVGVILSIYIFSNIKNLNFKIYFDTVSCVAPIGIFFGRISNFINSELYGPPTTKPWGVIFPEIDNLSRHPSQIYEAILEGLILFFVMFVCVKKNYLLKPGLISSLFLIFYSLFRFFVEFYRVPDEHLGLLFLNLTIGQMISIIFLCLGFYFFFIKKNENK